MQQSGIQNKKSTRRIKPQVDLHFGNQMATQVQAQKLKRQKAKRELMERL